MNKKNVEVYAIGEFNFKFFIFRMIGN